ncbi:MAG TPA: DUF2911 domain-containing protein [Bacteroidia bacterium]|jgi:hypothetical protein|nr:DUF2911 domain-containing protein [Bacteroidia bacterium]
MIKIKKLIALTAAALLFVFNINAQTLKVPAPSPLQTIKQNFGIGEVTLEYSRPSIKGRVIFGDVVPFGKVWRTGANATTKITFTEDITLEGKLVVAGTYGIYSVPNKTEWEIMLYKDVTLGGDVANYKPENEVLRVKVKPTLLLTKTETFTMEFADITPTTCSLELVWEKTRVSVKLSTDIDTKVMKNIETVMAPSDKRPYYQSASYYYENNKDLNQAFEWVNKAIDQNPKAYWAITLKAKILSKQKDYKGSIETSEKAIVAAKEDQNDDYVKINEKLIAENKKEGKIK